MKCVGRIHLPFRLQQAGCSIGCSQKYPSPLMSELSRCVVLLTALVVLLPHAAAATDLVRTSSRMRPKVDFDAPPLNDIGFDWFGASVAHVGGRTLAVGCPHASAAGAERGAVFLLTLHESGGVDTSSVRSLPPAAGSPAEPLFEAPTDYDRLGSALTTLDIDGDGQRELVVSANQNETAPTRDPYQTSPLSLTVR